MQAVSHTKDTEMNDTIPNQAPLSGDGYFGLCPHCKKTDGYINIGRGHWFFCKEHKVCWFAGSNLFSDWQTEDEQRAQYEQLGFHTFERIEAPFYPADILRRQKDGADTSLRLVSDEQPITAEIDRRWDGLASVTVRFGAVARVEHPHAEGSIMNGIVIEEYTAVTRNALRGFARVRMPSGTIFHDVGIYEKDGKRWASPPSKPMLGRDGKQMRGRDVMTFASKEIRDKFSSFIIAALEATHPEAFR